MTGAIAGVILAAAVAVPTQAEDAALTTCRTATAPTRILLYGDSVTQSFNSDWTWRYRL